MRSVQVALPERLIERFGGEAGAAARISRAAVIEFLHEGEMTSGEAAEALAVTRREILDLMAQRNIPTASYDPEELGEELKALGRDADRR